MIIITRTLVRKKVLNSIFQAHTSSLLFSHLEKARMVPDLHFNILSSIRNKNINKYDYATIQ
jgi:hypothetical protein